jgi:hypothetical protein
LQFVVRALLFNFSPLVATRFQLSPEKESCELTLRFRSLPQKPPRLATLSTATTFGSLITGTALTHPIYVRAFNSGPSLTKCPAAQLSRWGCKGAQFLLCQDQAQPHSALSAIAMDTAEGKIFKLSFATMLTCSDVIYLEGRRMKS